MKISLIIILVLVRYSIFYSCDSIKVIAHRGVSSLAPENTLPAFQLGIDLGVDYIELDVQKSADDSLIVIHDPTVDGTTSYSGLVSSYTYTELKEMDAGSWFSSEFIGTEIPTLYEALDLLRNKAKICVELKASEIENQAIQLIEDMGLVNDVVIESFDYGQLQTVRQQNPNIKLCYLASILTQTVVDDAAALNAEIIGSGLDPNIWLIKNAQDQGIEVWNYTINEGNSMVHRISKGLNGLFTDNPQDMIGVKTFMLNGGLIAHWNMDENGGQSISDLSPSENDLLINNASWTNGIINSGLQFNGVDQYISVPLSNSLNIASDQVSLSTWVKLNQLPSAMQGPFGPIYDSDEDSYILYLDKSNEELRFKVTDVVGLTARPGIPESLLNTGQWLHVACVYNGKEAIIYLNGEMIDVATTTGIGNLKQNQVASFGTNNGNFFNGSIDDFKIYQRPLSPHEIRQIYNQETVSCDNLNTIVVSYDTLGFPTIDETTACPNYTVSENYFDLNFIMEFDGMNYINANNLIPQLKNNSHSFFTWIKTSNPTNDERIFAVNDRYGGNNFLFGIYNGSINIYTNSTHYTGLTDIGDNNWHFIGYSWDIQSQQVLFFVDGNVEGSYMLDLSVESTDRISIGQEFDEYQCSNYYHGLLGEISIWNSIQTLSDMIILMNQAPSNSNNLIGYFQSAIQCNRIVPDNSFYQNNGYSCRNIKYEIDTLPNYNSNASITWSNYESGEILSNNGLLSTNISSNSTLVYNLQQPYLMISDTVTMSTYESPEIYGFNDTTICTNQNLILNPGEFSSYQWSNGSTEPTQSMNSNEPTNIVISVVVTNENNCSAEDSINITIEDCSSLNEIAQIQVYPNPSMNGKFHFLELNNTTFKLFDIQGKEIDYKNITTDSFQTNFKGIAFLRLENEKQTCFKLVFK